ncbi:putative lipoprotein with Yx(FWY)xxD motif [Bradyrhizobium sp. JR4.1]|jgi:predicted lipoprotein with Yx(FWY)xxD motif|uniref:COG4315 family predicted lipoprotein n=1 Tax=unclassified Bradyrhizobium TaxID=2631580 RepID=UPI0033949405
MFRFLIAAAAIALSTAPALANGHGGGDAPPPPKPATSPAKVILTKQGPTLVDLNGMTLYYYERDTTGKTSNCNGKCVESWVPLSATADAKAIGDFTVINRNDGSKMWAYRYRPLYTSPADKAPGEANGNATTLQWRIARPEN